MRSSWFRKTALRGQGGRRRPGAWGRLREPTGVVAARQCQSRGASSRRAALRCRRLWPPEPRPAPPAGGINGAAAGPALLGAGARVCSELLGAAGRPGPGLRRPHACELPRRSAGGRPLCLLAGPSAMGMAVSQPVVSMSQESRHSSASVSWA